MEEQNSLDISTLCLYGTATAKLSHEGITAGNEYPVWDIRQSRDQAVSEESAGGTLVQREVYVVDNTGDYNWYALSMFENGR